MMAPTLRGAGRQSMMSPRSRPATSNARAIRAEAGNSKSALITGGNTGIGYETALVLLRKGYEVTLACRDPARAGKAQQLLRELVPGSKVDTVMLDLADLDSVRDCSSRLLDQGADFDVVLNNAGVMASPKMATKQGHEFQLGVNHLGHFALTNALLPALVAANKPVRIVNVASSAHLFGKIDFTDFNRDKNYQPWDAYGQSKLANVMFTYELARRLGPTPDITTNCLHPGVVKTELGRYMVNDSNRWYMGPAVLVASMLFKTPAQGAECSIHVTSSPSVTSTSGKYFTESMAVPSSPASYDTEVARKLWELSEELTERPAARAYATATAAGSSIV